MANIQITQLPAGGPITGTEQVPVVQNGVTVRVPTSAIAASPAQQQTFLTLNQEPTLPNSRALSGSLGIGLTDGGALSTLQITLNGASGSLEAAANGLVAKTGASTVTNRSIAVSGSGLSVTNGSGASGDPTLALSGLPASLAGLSGTGILNMIGSTSVGTITILGTSDQIDVANGNGVGNPTISITANPILPGVEGVVVPFGDTASRAALPINGELRYNTDLAVFEGYANGAWGAIVTGSGVTSVNASGGTTGFSFTGGPITSSGTLTLTGTLGVPNGGTGAVTLTGYVKGNGTSAMTASATVPTTDLSGTVSNAQLANSAITINGNSVSLGGSTTVTASTTAALTIGTGLSGTSFNGSTAVTIAIDSTVATLTGTQTLTNKSISGSTNTLTDIANASLTNSSVTVGTTAIALGASSLTLGGLTSVAVTQDPTSALQLATKQYVDAVAEGLHVHAPSAAATTGTLASITGGTVTYNNGTAGVGATLTLSVALTVLDGYTLLNGDRVLVKNEVASANNGIYTWATGGTVLTRATDFDTAAEMASGDFTFVTNGTLYANTGWVQTDPVTVVGTSPVTWIQFSGAGTYTAGTGLTLSGSQFSITNTAVTAGAYGSASTVPTFTVNAQGQLTLATDASIAINGNQITSGTVGSSYISGSYTSITGVGTLTAGTWNASTVEALYGGTGLTSYAAGDLIYASGTTALSKLGLGTQGQVLVAGASAPTWGSIAGGTF